MDAQELKTLLENNPHLEEGLDLPSRSLTIRLLLGQGTATMLKEYKAAIDELQERIDGMSEEKTELPSYNSILHRFGCKDEEQLKQLLPDIGILTRAQYNSGVKFLTDPENVSPNYKRQYEAAAEEVEKWLKTLEDVDIDSLPEQASEEEALSDREIEAARILMDAILEQVGKHILNLDNLKKLGAAYVYDLPKAPSIEEALRKITLEG